MVDNTKVQQDENFIEKDVLGEIKGESIESLSFSYRIIKRFFDIIISGVMLIIIIPVFAVFSGIYLIGENKGPLFYRQVRVGRNGKKFKMYKFRSMVVDADKKLLENKELYAKYVANSYKLPAGEDPRVTKFGSFIRRTSLDELPQFINIFKGDMSIIGPRPIVEEELAEYETAERINKLLSVTPGAMGYWQAIGRSNIEYPERCEVELYYVDHASLLFDFQIIFKNIVSIFKNDGAY
ncbi:sugar transferase [Latilactobacillus curvatus]|uniref:sugar transferase n=1 Tax=Latilactobacillus curvatus TaxID=28038 RepID=UPI000B5DBBD2|nr:sugar transferase [Latilactobacillus curvatus]ASN61545.1 multidrug MFS transporter [Latilactobacillus curvatus]MCT2880811.1 sugar transferase [Latilactobacillus curvatus]